MMGIKKSERSIDTIISKDTVIEGKITLPTSLRVDGKIYGEIECGGIVYIGKGAYVEPVIRAKNIVIAGEVKGDVIASEKVRIEPSGKLIGSISSKGIVIEDGGTFNGTSMVYNMSSVEEKELITEPKTDEVIA